MGDLPEKNKETRQRKKNPLLSNYREIRHSATSPFFSRQIKEGQPGGFR